MSLNTAFAELRKKHKLAARMNFRCCQGCAGSALVGMVDAMPSEKKPKGYVFYHKQDAAHLTKDGYVWIAFGAFEHTKVPDKAFGKLAEEVFAAHGCPVDWDGSGGTRLRVWRDENTKREHAAKLLGKAA